MCLWLGLNLFVSKLFAYYSVSLEYASCVCVCVYLGKPAQKNRIQSVWVYNEVFTQVLHEI